MLEVMISMIIIMFGALGVAGMQLMAITSTENARYQNAATNLASSLAGAMQANVTYWGTPPALITVNGATSTGGPAAFTGDCLATAATECTATQMAAYDLRLWGAEVARVLPLGQAALECPAGASPAICTVTLTWKENNVSLHNASTTETGQLATGKQNDHTYQTLVSIL